MNIIEALRTGKKIKRHLWFNYIERDAGGNMAYGDGYGLYVPGDADLLADDWKIVTSLSTVSADKLREALTNYMSKTLADQVINDLGLE